ncbi:MAG: SAM-dependent methyltransferase, partial [Bacteroidetes bacterium]
MTTEEFEILTQGHIRALIETHLHSDPASFAMNQVHNEFPVALVSTQLKYLQKSREKLPRWYEARCIVPPRAYEQCSSEAAAALKPALSGGRCLDLTMGLGVDSAHFSRSFTQVTALEPDPVLSRVVAFNLGLMGLSNIQIIQERAEDFLERYEGPAYDLIYADPSRRDAAGKRDASLAGGSPDVLQLLPLLLRHGRQVLLKISPLFDVEEARRLFPGCDLMVISIGGECKELLIRLPGTQQLEIRLGGKDTRTYTYPSTPPASPIPLTPP